MPFDIDRYLNRVIPNPRYERWPRFISYWVGYRLKDWKPRSLHELALDFWILLGSFAGMIVAMAVLHYGKTFVDRLVPIVIPSTGATAILVYNASDSPLAQPRNVFFGTFLSSLIGVILMKLTMTNPNNQDHLWIVGALSVGIASVAMKTTKCLHPPAGAAAIIPLVDSQVQALGWYYLPVQMVSMVLIIAVGCAVNNIQTRYPVYWWFAGSLEKPKKDVHIEQQEEKTASSAEVEVCAEIKISKSKFVLPEGLQLTDQEQLLLDQLQQKL